MLHLKKLRAFKIFGLKIANPGSRTRRSHHPSQYTKAKFVSAIRRIPGPPAKRGEHTSCHKRSDNGCDWSSLKPQKKRQNWVSMDLQSCWGNRKDDIPYIGITEATDLINMAHPTWERSLAFHPVILLLIRLWISLKSSCLDFWHSKGRPKCLEDTVKS